MSDEILLCEAQDNTEDIVNEGVHNYSTEESYVHVTDPLLKERIEWFKDQKLALMMHWGPYSQWGIEASWSLCDADSEWSRNDIDWYVDNREFRRQYFDLNKTFNPVKFNPEAWAKLAKESGFKYFIFTTKHHDGFCMWDTAYTDYKITGEDCPFHTNPKADIIKHLWEAFRKEGLGIAAYFSKADWHIPYYWNYNFERGDFTWRGPSYEPVNEPELWEKFVQYTHNQLLELATKYGKIDILWLDAGWVRKGDGDDFGQDIRLNEIVDRIRKFQPWLICADRTVGGPYENYVTPELCIPEKPLNIPWESCLTLGNSWTFKFGDTFKTPREVIGLLLSIITKGGNLALDIGPQPDGKLPIGAVKSLEGIGKWLKLNGEGVYETRVCAPYTLNNFFFTKNPKTNSVYAFRYFKEEITPEAEMIIPYKGKVNAVTLLETGEKVEFTLQEDGIKVTLPEMDTKPITVGFKIV